MLYFNELIHFDGYAEWVSGFVKSMKEGVSHKVDAPFNSLPVYGAAYRLAVETTQMASRLERNYRYSLGEIARRTGADRKTVTRLIDAYEAAIKSDPDMGIDEFLDGVPTTLMLPRLHHPSDVSFPMVFLAIRNFCIFVCLTNCHAHCFGRT